MATVQQELITHEQISTLFWLNLIISGSIGLCILAGAPLLALFYDKQELVAITIALSFSFLISGFTIQHQALLNRHMRFGILASIQILSQCISMIISIVMAANGWQYWALVGGMLTNTLCMAILTFFFCPWIPGKMYRGSGVRGMLRFGSHITGFSFINYFARNADNLLIGRYIGAEGLGLYDRAYSLFLLPISQIKAPLDRVAIPILSSLRNHPERYAKYFNKLLDTLATLTLPITLYSAIEADFLIRLILGMKWAAASPIFQILVIAGMVQAIASTRGLVLISLGYSVRYFYWGLFNATICVLSFVIGINYGIKGVALSYTIANIVILIPSLIYCFQSTPIRVYSFFKTLFPPFIVSICCGLIILYIKIEWSVESIEQHLVCLCVYISTYCIISVCRKSIRETIFIVFNRLSSNSAE